MQGHSTNTPMEVAWGSRQLCVQQTGELRVLRAGMTDTGALGPVFNWDCRQASPPHVHTSFELLRAASATLGSSDSLLRWEMFPDVLETLACHSPPLMQWAPTSLIPGPLQLGGL